VNPLGDALGLQLGFVLFSAVYKVVGADLFVVSANIFGVGKNTGRLGAERANFLGSLGGPRDECCGQPEAPPAF
jgi:hypothetical protein